MTLLLLAGDVEVNPGPGGSSFPCGLCEIDANWLNGGIACEHCDVWYHRVSLAVVLDVQCSKNTNFGICVL